MSIDSKLALTVDFLRDFIEVYHMHPSLWKVGSKEYVDKSLKKVGYEELINKCRDYCITADRDFVVRKINSLRGAFRKEHNKVLAAAAIGQKYAPVLWYYKLLLFTSDKEVPESVYKDGSTGDSDDQQEYLMESSEEMFGENSVGACSNADGVANSEDTMEKKYDITEHDEMAPMESLAEEHLQINIDHPKENVMRRPRIYCRPSPYSSSRKAYDGRITDEFTAIGISVAAKLKRMDETQRYYAETLMTKVLGLGLLGKLTENTEVYIKPTPLSPSVNGPIMDQKNSEIT